MDHDWFNYMTKSLTNVNSFLLVVSLSFISLKRTINPLFDLKCPLTTNKVHDRSREEQVTMLPFCNKVENSSFMTLHHLSRGYGIGYRFNSWTFWHWSILSWCWYSVIGNGLCKMNFRKIGSSVVRMYIGLVNIGLWPYLYGVSHHTWGRGRFCGIEFWIKDVR